MVLDNFGSWWQEVSSHLGKNDKKPLKHSQLRVETNLNALAELLDWFEQFNSPILPCHVWYECQTALAEGFTNAVRHAHQRKGLPETTPIDIEVIVFPKHLEIRIWDWGDPFDLKAKIQSIPPEDMTSLVKEGGRGLLFMQKLTDELCYDRLSDQRNCLIMRKNITNSSTDLKML